MIKRFLALILFCFTVLNCSSIKDKHDMEEVIEVTKFMYLNEYPIAIYEKSFWANKDEHATFRLPYDKENFLEEIKVLPSMDCSNFDFYNYSFVIKRIGEKNDTVYADTSLKTWIFKINGKTECRYDEKGTYTDFLRQHYPFFKDCW